MQTNYSLLNNKKHYTDYSVIGILKNIFNAHKINRYEYKESIKRLKNGRPLKTGVNNQVQSFLHTVTMLKLGINKSAENKRFITLELKNSLNYAVNLKKRTFDTLINNRFLDSEYKLEDKIEIQANKKLEADNKLIIGGEKENRV